MAAMGGYLPARVAARPTRPETPGGADGPMKAVEAEDTGAVAAMLPDGGAASISCFWGPRRKVRSRFDPELAVRAALATAVLCAGKSPCQRRVLACRVLLSLRATLSIFRSSCKIKYIMS